jgi:hypothetical protein
MVRGGEQKEFVFEKMLNNKSESLVNHSYTLEYTSNPAWYAIQALPYLMEYPYECAEQVFSRFYANAVSSALVNSSPRIKAIFDSWKISMPAHCYQIWRKTVSLNLFCCRSRHGY